MMILRLQGTIILLNLKVIFMEILELVKSYICSIFVPSGTKLCTQWAERDTKKENLLRISYGSISGKTGNGKADVRSTTREKSTFSGHSPLPSSILCWLTLFFASIRAFSWVTCSNRWFCSFNWVFKAFKSAIFVSLELRIPSIKLFTSVTPVRVSAMLVESPSIFAF